MLIPIGAVKNVPVTLLRVSREPLLVVEGHIIYFDGRNYQITLKDADSSFQEGEQVLVDLGTSSSGRRRARVKAVSPAVIQVEIERFKPPERREFPRIEARVDLEFQLLEPEERHKMEAWLRHPHLSDATAVWRRPDPFMDFSVTGIKFNTPQPLEPGQFLCLRFKLLTDQVFTCGAEVVRIEESPEGGFMNAVAFIGLDDPTTDALMQYTRHCQDIILGLDSLHDE